MLDHPVFQEKIREWFKVFRKNNCALTCYAEHFRRRELSRLGRDSLRNDHKNLPCQS